ncbi:MAG TPA: ECF-type sigma factor [Phycisphaerales bacterium]|nr:ECF-type sigma factor [Phycisphaerales bacterium]HMP37475.1 ECF-type sigma factor [Phycisphaerales bacterium]
MTGSSLHPDDRADPRFGVSAADRARVAPLLAHVYADLRNMARALLRARGGSAIDPTSVVHEVCIRVLAARSVALRDRAHLRALAAVAMRQILVDHSRRRRAIRRGGSVAVVPLDGSEPARRPPAGAPESDDAGVDVLALSESILRLHGEHARQARVVELRFFGGLTIDEAAAALDVSRATIANDWRFARAWIIDDMRRHGAA